MKECDKCCDECCECMYTTFIGCVVCGSLLAGIYMILLTMFVYSLDACEENSKFENCNSYIWAMPIVFVIIAVLIIMLCRTCKTLCRQCLIKQYRYEESKNKIKSNAEGCDQEREEGQV
jgi:hypothetical protein